MQCVLWRFKWISRNQDKLSYIFYLHKLSLSIDTILLHIFFSCNLLIFVYSPGIEKSKIRYFQSRIS